MHLDQGSLAARMQALGFSAWVRQTVTRVESGRRRLTAEELLGLAYVLGISLASLLDPPPDDKAIAFPSGQAISASSVRLSLHYRNDGAVTWKGDNPVFSDGTLPEPGDLLEQVLPAAAAALPLSPQQQAVLTALIQQMSQNPAAVANILAAGLRELPPDARDAAAAALDQDSGEK